VLFYKLFREDLIVYINYVSDRNELGYKCLLDIECGNGLVLITDSTFVFVKDVACTAKGKTKKLIIVSILGGALYFSNVQPSEAIGLPMPPTPVVRVHKPSYDYRSKIKVAPAVSPKLDKITFIKYRELPLCIYVMDRNFIVRPEISKIIRELRAGDFSGALVGNAILLVVLYGILTLVSGADGFQIPVVHPRNGAVIAPANGGVQGQVNHPKHGGRITVRMSESNQCPADQTQVSSFVKDSKVDLRQCYDEVMRRAKSLNCENWSCEFKRFQSLAMEQGRVDENSAREAITVLNGEMLGFYKHSERVSYGKGVYGPDFKVIGQGAYSHVTHVEVKNPVGSDIEKASCNGYSDIVKQGNRIGNKLSKQQSKWSNDTFRASLSNIDPNVAFPQSPANTLGLVDEFDVPIAEKMIVQNAVKNNCTNTSNVIFINNETNI